MNFLNVEQHILACIVHDGHVRTVLSSYLYLAFCLSARVFYDANLDAIKQNPPTRMIGTAGTGTDSTVHLALWTGM